MIALIKNNGELIYFKMKSKSAELVYAKTFLQLSEDDKLNIGKYGIFPKKDVINLICVDNEEEAKAFHKGTINLLNNIIITYQQRGKV
jgi:hypothetical protein